MTVQSNFPSIKPSLLLDFANVKALDPRITFTRTTTATYYDGVTTAKAEENLFTYSQEFDSGWVDTSVTTTDNNSVAPNGTTTASLIQASASAARVGIQRGITLVSGVDYAISFFAKAGTHDIVQVAGIAGAFSGNGQANFDLTNGVLGTVSGGTATITSVGNSWYRCTWVATSSTTSATLYITLIDSTTAGRFDSTGIVSGDNVELWGAQLEQRSAVSSYTPTTTARITNYIPVLQTAASGVARFDHNPTTGESLGLLVEEQRTNLLTYSAEFDNAAWSKGDSSITANAVVAPDGTLTGDKLVENTASAQHRVFASLATGSTAIQTHSIYAKAGERNWVYLSTDDSAGVRRLAYFDLSIGVVGSTTGFDRSSIVPVGNGWYRCSVSVADNGGNTLFIVAVTTGNNTSSYTGDGYSGIYIWGAQLEVGAFPTSYIATTTATVTRNADAASMTGTNFSSWFNNAEGTLYGEVSSAAITISGTSRRIANITDGTESNRITIAWAGATSVGAAFATVSGVTQAGFNSPSGAYPFPTKVSIAYKVNSFNASVNASAFTEDTSGTVPVVNRMTIGDIVTGGTIQNINGTIKKISYYPSRLSDAQLQALTAS